MAMKQTLSSKILVTNRAALLAKYGSSGVKAIARAVRPAMSIANTYLHEGAVARGNRNQTQSVLRRVKSNLHSPHRAFRGTTCQE